MFVGLEESRKQLLQCLRLLSVVGCQGTIFIGKKLLGQLFDECSTLLERVGNGEEDPKLRETEI